MNCPEHHGQKKLSCISCIQLDWKTTCCIAEKLFLCGEISAAAIALGDKIIVPDLVAAAVVEDLVHRINPQQLPAVVVREVNVYARPDSLG